MTSLTSIMRERHDFKGQLKCSAGNKPCGGRCVPSNYKCADEGGAAAGGRGRMAKRALGTAAAIAGVGAAGVAAYKNREALGAMAAQLGEQARNYANTAGESLNEAGQRAYAAAGSGVAAARQYSGQLGEQMRGLAGTAAEAGQGALNNARSAGTELLQQGEALAGRARSAGEAMVTSGTAGIGALAASGRRRLGMDSYYADADCKCGGKCKKCKEEMGMEGEPDKDDALDSIWADMYQDGFWADAACGPGMRKCGNSCISGNSKCNSTGEKVKTAAKIGAGVAALGGAGYAAYRNREAIGEGAKAAGSAIKSGAGAAAGAVRSGASKAWGAAKKLVGRDSVWADGYEYLPAESL